MQKITKIKNTTFKVILYLDSHGEVYEECSLDVFSAEDALFEANEMAVEFSGFTIDNWINTRNNTYELQRGSGEQFILQISKGD